MFQIGDTIVYGHSGVCRIADIREETFGPMRQTYYVLTPLYSNNSTIYCPVEQTKIPLRTLPTRQEVDELIHSMPTVEGEWILGDADRRAAFTDMLKSGDRARVTALVATIYRRRCTQTQAGKKLHLADERILRDAERLLYEEFAHVLDIRPDEVSGYIRSQLEAG